MRYYFKKCSHCGFPIKVKLSDNDTWAAFGHLGNYDKPHACRQIQRKTPIHPGNKTRPAGNPHP
jgi:hypothetical protein